MSSGLRYDEAGMPWSDDSITYYAPQPRAVLRVVDPNNTDRTVDYGGGEVNQLAALKVAGVLDGDVPSGAAYPGSSPGGEYCGSLNSPVAMRFCHSAGPVMCALVPPASTATVTGMSCTSNS